LISKENIVVLLSAKGFATMVHGDVVWILVVN